MRTAFLVLLTILSSLLSSPVCSQVSLCPPNLDFEEGNFSSWDLRSGMAHSIAGVSSIDWSGGEAGDRHTMIRGSSLDIDPWGLFPVACPNGSGFNVKLGNANTGSEAEGMFYTFTIPPSTTSFSIIYYYAVVFEDPGHDFSEQPRFVARIVNVTDNTDINCVSFDFTAEASLPGFQVSSQGANTRVLYKDWTPVSLNLSAYAGKTIRLEFITNDCTRGGHFGYAYVDVNSNCTGIIDGASVCRGSSATTLTAPYGFASYAWYSDNTFSQLVGTNQQLALNPLPSIGSTYTVIVDPFTGFGCRDTLYAILNIAPIPIAGFTVNKDTQCITNNSFSFDNTSTISSGEPMTWLWKFSDGTTDRVKHPSKRFSSAGQFTAELVISSLSHCKDSIQKVVNVVLNGNPDFTWDSICIGRTTRFENLSSENGTVSAHYNWDFKNGILSDSKTPPGFVYPNPGNFDVTLIMSVYGCETAPQIMAKSVRVNAPAKGIRYYDITVPPGYDRYLEARARIGNNYDWQPAIQLNNYSVKNPLFHAINDVEYKINITDIHTCITSDTQQVWILKKPGSYLPTAFTPNGDGLNDDLIPYLIGMKKLKRFSIYNRYGNLVFTTTTENDGWDGTYKGKALDTGVFIWLLEYVDNNDKAITEKGNVTLIK
ncbi:MAG TPA: PKD domain-containing protein [Chitinophagaceae bacterium]|nr:PKD domain-containing protein [Chitinophagaceae bacterium]